MFLKPKTKPKKDVILVLVVMVAFFSIGMTTIQLKAAYAQDEKFSALLSGSQKSHLILQQLKDGLRSNLWVMLLAIN